MPWAVVPKKDVVGSDIRRGGVNILRSGGFRMGKPAHLCAAYYEGNRKIEGSSTVGHLLN